MERREVISKCMEMGVPIFQGRIDKTLFLASIKQATQGQARLRSQRPERRFKRAVAAAPGGVRPIRAGIESIASKGGGLRRSPRREPR